MIVKATSTDHLAAIARALENYRSAVTYRDTLRGMLLQLLTLGKDTAEHAAVVAEVEREAEQRRAELAAVGGWVLTELEP